MFFIPGPLIALITFPGVIVHELAHQWFCRLFGVAVLDVCYFRFGNPAGYVIHEHPTRDYQQILIGIGPFLVNSVLGVLIALPGAIPALQFSSGTPVDYFLVWLGVSIAMHAFPSTGDAKSIWTSVWGRETSWLTRLVTIPIVGLIYLGAFGSIFWLDALWGVGLTFGLSALIVNLMA
jgi:hypothetical protein